MVSLNSCLVAASLFLAARSQAVAPQVTVDKATIVGQYDAVNDVDAFLGIKYATMKRFERSQMTNYYQAGLINATVHAPACAQINNATGYDKYGVTEDCGYLEIYRPHNVPKGQTLPVMVWIHGGGGNYGSANYYEAYKLVNQAQSINLPVIVVTINYRLAVWGYAGGKEAAQNKAENLGLYDQRTALQWIQEFIGAFGGDKSKVTLFGQSSGSMSIQYHYLDESSTLFRAGIMESGGVASVPAIPASRFQGNYDAFIAAIGCKSAADTFACLKSADFGVVQNTVNAFVAAPQTYSTRPWGVSIDGDIIGDQPSILVAKGKFAKKPFILGDVLDEGTFFPKPTPINTADDMWGFFQRDYLGKGASFLTNQTTLDKLSQLYPEDPASGSPFNTGDNTFGFGADYKRAAALYGDLRYHGPRRSFFNDAVKAGAKGWSYQLSQFTPSSTPAAYGVYHSLDISYIFMSLSTTETQYTDLSKLMISYWVSFAHNLDPNHAGNPTWPTYDHPNGNLLEFTAAKTSVIADSFRNEAISFINSIPEQFGAPRS